MVLSFNKRELIEFANWNTLQERFPKCVFMIPENYDLSLLFCLMKRKCYTNYHEHIIDGFKEIVSKNKCGFVWGLDLLGDGGSSYWIYPEDKIKSTYSDFTVISVEEFEKHLIYENVAILTNEDLSIWLKHEKNITINK